jgi:flagellar basal-body rod modification protein FlgD
MAVNPISQSYSTTPTTTTTNKANNAEMDQDGFLKLFLASLQNQDPMAPMDNAQMMQQMAMLSQMQQIMKMEQTVTKLSDSLIGSQLQQGAEFIGKKVTTQDSEGTLIEGLVKSVSIENGNVNLWFGDGTKVLMSEVKAISE